MKVYSKDKEGDKYIHNPYYVQIIEEGIYTKSDKGNVIINGQFYKKL